MNYFLEEKDSINIINSIRVEPFAKMQSNEQKQEGKIKISSEIEIIPFHNIWNSITFTVIITANKLEPLKNSSFELALNSSLNSDKLVLANSETQRYNNSNIFDVADYMFNQVWVPIAKGELTVTEEQYTNLLPDNFELVEDSEIVDKKVSALFDYVTSTPELSNLLYAEFYMGSQPIYVLSKDFMNFCRKYEILNEMR